jgi:hypothetical protein
VVGYDGAEEERGVGVGEDLEVFLLACEDRLQLFLVGDGE